MLDSILSFSDYDQRNDGSLLAISAQAKHRWAELSTLPGVYSG